MLSNLFGYCSGEAKQYSLAKWGYLFYETKNVEAKLENELFNKGEVIKKHKKKQLPLLSALEAHAYLLHNIFFLIMEYLKKELIAPMSFFCRASQWWREERIHHNPWAILKPKTSPECLQQSFLWKNIQGLWKGV